MRVQVQQIDEALRMLDTFASVGATHFGLTHTTIDGEKRGFRPTQSLGQIKNSMPKLFPGAAERLNNIIIRPHGDNMQFVQLDDLDAAALSRVGEAAFLTLETSPGNHQAWIAVSGASTPEDAKDLARRLRKVAGADPSASGATRVAGTLNYKRKYEPEFPTVRIAASHPGRVMTKEELEGGGPRCSIRAPCRQLHREDHVRLEWHPPAQEHQGMAGPCPFTRRCPAQPSGNGTGSQHGGVYLVHDGD